MPEIFCDVGLLRIAFSNLLRNAIKYGREHGTIRIRLTLEGGSVEIVVWNQGPGFPESERTNLFHMFTRLDDPDLKKEKGTGIGLYSTWRIMQLHRGRVRAQSKQGEWAKFILTLPVVQQEPVPREAED